MALLRPASLVVALVLGACYAPHVKDCDIRCSPTGGCPSDTTCMGDGWCHVSTTSVCLADGGTLFVDARVLGDAPIVGDAPLPDAGAPDASIADAAVADVPALPDAVSAD